MSAQGRLEPHPVSSLQLDEREYAVGWPGPCGTVARPGASPKCCQPGVAGLHLPDAAGRRLVPGCFRRCRLASQASRSSPPTQRDLVDGFDSSQIALLQFEREQLSHRAAGEREKLLAESDRLHRTLFDSVSHELKTPLLGVAAPCRGRAARYRHDVGERVQALARRRNSHRDAPARSRWSRTCSIKRAWNPAD